MSEKYIIFTPRKSLYKGRVWTKDSLIKEILRELVNSYRRRFATIPINEPLDNATIEKFTRHKIFEIDTKNEKLKQPQTFSEWIQDNEKVFIDFIQVFNQRIERITNATGEIEMRIRRRTEDHQKGINTQ